MDGRQCSANTREIIGRLLLSREAVSSNGPFKCQVRLRGHRTDCVELRTGYCMARLWRRALWITLVKGKNVRPCEAFFSIGENIFDCAVDNPLRKSTLVSSVRLANAARLWASFREKDILRMPDTPIMASAAPRSSQDRKSGPREGFRNQPRVSGRGCRYQPISIRVDPPVIALLDAARARRGVTRSWFIADMLRNWANLPEPETETSDRECAA